MRNPLQIRKEYKAVCKKMAELYEEGDGIPSQEALYMRLYSIRMTLEWVHPALIKTTTKKHAERLTELAGYKHYVFGPLFATLFP